MTFKTIIIITTVLLAVVGVHAQDEQQPATGGGGGGTRAGTFLCETVVPVQDFDVDTYASERWFVQEQQKTFFSNPSQTCVRADYKVLDEPTKPWGYTIEVNNQQGQDENNGDPDFPLCAYQVKEGTGQLAVAPCQVPNIFAGAYWVVAYDEDEGYALVSGGQPYIPTEDGLCRTGTTYFNSGLFILTRQQSRDEDLVQQVKDIAVGLGIDTSLLFEVDQVGCPMLM